MISKYWKLVRLDAAGGVKSEDIQEAKEFFQQQFPDQEHCEAHSEASLHRQLFALSQFDRIREAQLCLRCFISHQIHQVCRKLAAQYHLDGNLLFPLVLDDIPDRRFHRPSAYRSLAHKILETFDPDRSSLVTWTVRLVKRHPELNEFLIQNGIYLISDWAILNDTKPQQIRRIFFDFYQLTSREIQEDCELLESYHQIYREQRLQERIKKASIGQCSAPTDRQLEQMCQYLYQNYNRMRSSKKVQHDLQSLAQKLRTYRIYVRGGKLVTQPLDHPAIQKEMTERRYQDFIDNENSSQGCKFFDAYDDYFQACLDQAIKTVTQIRLTQKTRRKVVKSPEEIASTFYLFYCEGKSQGEIAKQMGMTAQDQVAKMLNLKSFRADIRQKMLISLLKTVLEKAKIQIDPDRLMTVESQVESALEEQIYQAIPESGKPGKSLFVQRLCCYLCQILQSELKQDYISCCCGCADQSD